jgi:hypothetical protein
MTESANWTKAEQRSVTDFLADHELDADPAYRILDLAAEVGEVAADAAKSSEYGAAPDSLAVSQDELGTPSSHCSRIASLLARVSRPPSGRPRCSRSVRDSTWTRATHWRRRWRSTRHESNRRVPQAQVSESGDEGTRLQRQEDEVRNDEQHDEHEDENRAVAETRPGERLPRRMGEVDIHTGRRRAEDLAVHVSTSGRSEIRG